MELKLPAIHIGGGLLYLIDRYEEGSTIYDIDFEFTKVPTAIPRCGPRSRPPHPQRLPRPHGLLGQVLRRAFGFRQVRFFDIKGEYTGLVSRAMSAPDGKIRILSTEKSGQLARLKSFFCSMAKKFSTSLCTPAISPRPSMICVPRVFHS